MANRDLKIYAICLLNVLLLNLRPSITIQSPISPWVSFHNTQLSTPCLRKLVSRIDGVADRVCCVQIPPQSLVYFLSFRESVFPTLFWFQSKYYGVRLFPSSNGVSRFFTETSIFHYNRVCVSKMNLSDSGIGNQSWIWDPGIIICGSIVYVLSLWKHQFYHNRIVVSSFFMDIVEYWRHDLIYIGWFWLLRNVSARYTVESMNKIGMGTCSIFRRQNTCFIINNLLAEFRVEIVTGRKTVTCVSKSRNDCAQYPLASILGGEEDDGFVSLFYSNVNAFQYWPRPPFQLDFIWLGRFLSSLWQHRKRNRLVKQPWMRRQWIFPKDHRNLLLEFQGIWISRRRQDLESSPTTLDLLFLVKVMPMAFWSFSSMLIANKKCVKRGT